MDGARRPGEVLGHQGKLAVDFDIQVGGRSENVDGITGKGLRRDGQGPRHVERARVRVGYVAGFFGDAQWENLPAPAEERTAGRRNRGGAEVRALRIEAVRGRRIQGDRRRTRWSRSRGYAEVAHEVDGVDGHAGAGGDGVLRRAVVAPADENIAGGVVLGDDAGRPNGVGGPDAPRKGLRSGVGNAVDDNGQSKRERCDRGPAGGFAIELPHGLDIDRRKAEILDNRFADRYIGRNRDDGGVGISGVRPAVVVHDGSVVVCRHVLRAPGKSEIEFKRAGGDEVIMHDLDPLRTVQPGVLVIETDGVSQLMRSRAVVAARGNVHDLLSALHADKGVAAEGGTQQLDVIRLVGTLDELQARGVLPLAHGGHHPVRIHEGGVKNVRDEASRPQF